MFRAYVLIVKRTKFHYTASGITKYIGGRLVYTLRENWCICASSCLITETNYTPLVFINYRN